MTARPLVVLVLAAACAREPEPEAGRALAPAVPGVETAVATVAPVRDAVEAFGTVAPAGEPAELRDARSALAEAKARHRLATQQVRRLEGLAEGAVAPRKELDAARAEESSAAAAAERSREALAGFGEDGGRRPLRGEETWVIAHVIQADVSHVAAGAGARLAADAFPGRTFPGRVDGAPAYVDPATRTAPVRIRVEDPGGVLVPGMTGAVTIEAGGAHDAVVVPAAAVVHDGDAPIVFVDAGEAGFAPRRVQLGIARDGRVEVVSGLEAGARVVTVGASSLLSALSLPAGGRAE
jgi:multidrug efflux pump subunit AcrA (membrane-fusion protein)